MGNSPQTERKRLGAYVTTGVERRTNNREKPAIKEMVNLMVWGGSDKKTKLRGGLKKALEKDRSKG